MNIPTLKKKKPYQRKPDPFYQSQQWKQLRNAFIKGNPYCCLCGAKASVADHIKQRIHGGTDTFDNLRPLCWDCHQRHTARQGQKAQAEKRKQQ